MLYPLIKANWKCEKGDGKSEGQQLQFSSVQSLSRVPLFVTP